MLTLPDDMMLIFHKNLPVIPARMVKYFEAPEFKKGGTAAPRRLGFAAGLLAAFTLFAGNVFTAVALKVATMPRARLDGPGATHGPGAGRLAAATRSSAPADADLPAARRVDAGAGRLPHQDLIARMVRAVVR